MPHGLKDSELQKLQDLFAANEHVEQVILYGSRAKGNYKPFSDVDITLVGENLTDPDLKKLSLAIDDLLLPYMFDISLFSTLKSDELLDHINRNGIILYKKKIEWKEYKLGEIADSCLGKMLDQKKNKGILQPYLGNVNVRWGSFDLKDLSEMRFLDSESERYGLRYGDLIVCEGGEPGRCAIWKDQISGMKIQKALHRVRVHEGFDCAFLYYWFLHAGQRNALEQYFTGTTIKHLPGDKLKSIVISLPPLSEQKRIASILSSLDDKIDLLRRENATLEAMAETIFRHHFIENPNPNWKEGKLGDLVKIKYGKDHKKLLDGGVPVFGSGGLMRHVNVALCKTESVLIPRKGTLNNVLYVDEPFWTMDTMFYTEMICPNIAKFIYLFVKEIDLAGMNVGSAVPSMTAEVLNNIPMDVPTQEAFDSFEDVVSPFFAKMKSNRAQTQTLTQTRNQLLQRLMSNIIV